jgi:tRNA wybutosine-synthesizing protein 2
MRAARVRRERAEEIRRDLFRIDAVRRDRKILEEGENVLFPLKDGVDASLAEEMGFELTETRGSPLASSLTPWERIRAEIDLPPALKDLIPRKWEKVGDVLILRLPPQLSPFKRKMAETYARVLGARTVCEEKGGISGAFREPSLEVIAGDGTETTHIENGIMYRLDVARLMFSSGNIDERIRMGQMDCRGQIVVDMFAGIGYFTLPVSVHGGARKVIACEINPTALHYLEQNIGMNNVRDIVEVFPHNNMKLEFEGGADRVIMGYVGQTRAYLRKAFDLSRPGGVVHYHDTFPTDGREELMRTVKKAVGERAFDVLCVREVKSYAPGISHFVADLRRR